MICTTAERDALMAAVEQYGIHKMQFVLAPDGSAAEQLAYDRADHYLAVIRAMLAPPDDAVVREEYIKRVAGYGGVIGKEDAGVLFDMAIAVLRGEATRDE